MAAVYREMRTAVDLKALARAHHLRPGLDESAKTPDQRDIDRAWLVTIPGRYGSVFVWGQTLPGATTDRRRLHPRLMAIPGAVVRQRGDRELTVSFPPDQLPAVADLLKIRRRRRLSPEAKAKAAERLKLARARIPARNGLPDAPCDGRTAQIDPTCRA
jgi:hypothetical protein